jgi:transglutaminase-like putative cysteine protease
MGSRRRTISAAVATVLASFSLYPVFSGSAWFWGGMGAAITIALAGTLTRLRRLPVLVCLLGGLAGLLLYLNLAFAHSQSVVLLIPTPSSLAHLWYLAGQGISESADYAPPVPELTGMVLLATGGIGLAALLVDLIAVRLRGAALAGLPLLLLFTEPFTLSVSRGWLGTTTVFCLATAGYLALLSSEGRERIRDWEQPQPGQRPGPAAGRPPDTRALTAAGRRVGVASVFVALCVPFFVPGLHFTRLFGGGSPGIGGTGVGGTGIVGLPNLQNQLGSDLRETAAQPVLSYTTTASAPGYFQVYVLPSLTAAGWQPSIQRTAVTSAAPKLPTAPGLTDISATSLVSTAIAVDKNVAQDSLSALPVPYPAVTVRADAGDVQTDSQSLMVFDSAQLAGLSYSVTSEDVAPSEQELTAAAAPPADIKSRYLQVPASYDALRGLAQSMVAGAKTPYAKAVALQNWFADGDFSYSLNARAISTEAGLANFLNITRTGYCQQFSYAMAVLARLLGIPSQVVYGYTQGTHAGGDRWTVSTHDAHAWPELYFQGYGWLRFEPTPGGPTGQGTATTPDYSKTQSSPSAQGSAGLVPITSPTSGSTSAKGGNSASRNRLPLASGNGGATPVTAAPGGLSPWALAGLSLLGLIVLILIVPGCARLVIRQRRWRAGARAGDAGLARAAWLELRDDLTDYGAGYRPSETPRALAVRVAAQADLDGAAGSAPARTAGLARLTATRAVAVPAREAGGDGAGAATGVATLVNPADLADTADLIGDADQGDVVRADGANRDVMGLDGVDLNTALRRVTTAAERARYSARPVSGDTLRQDIAIIRHAIAASASRRARWRARVFPPSVVAPALIALSQATDAFGRLNVSRVPLRKRRP